MATQTSTTPTAPLCAHCLSIGFSEAAAADDPLVIKPGQEWVSTAQLARRLGVEERWVKDHKESLGAMPLSDSPNAKYRYHLPTADAYLQGEMLKSKVPKRRTARRRKPGNNGPSKVSFV